MIKKNFKYILGVITGVLLCSGVVYAANLLASNIAYDNTNSGMKDSNNNDVTTVQGAIDVLYDKAENAGVPGDAIDFSTINTNTTKKVLASSKGVCINRNNKLNCFKINNWSEEQNHIQQVFSDISCNVDSSYVDCEASDFNCRVYSDDHVYCRDLSDNSGCTVYGNGLVICI